MKIIYNGTPHEVDEGTTVAALLSRLELVPRYVAVELNEQVVPRARHAECHLQSGDHVEIVTLVGGG